MNGAVVVAAGRSRRMGGQDKLWLRVAGMPLLGHTIVALSGISSIGRIILVTTPESAAIASDLRSSYPWDSISAVVAGGDERPDSVYAGLLALGDCELVVVHDGARPLVTRELVEAGLAAAQVHGAAVPALAVTDTIKVVDSHGSIVSTPDRAALRSVQTPQVFRYDLLLRAYREAGHARVACTDDAMLLERLGVAVATFPGDPHNIKVSSPADLPMVEMLLEARHSH